MNLLEIAKSLWRRVAVIAGLKNEVIDLQDKKVGLLTGEKADLTHKLEMSETQRTALQSKVANLEKELDRLRPKTGHLEDIQEKFLQFLAKHQPLTVRQIANGLGLSQVKAQRHADILLGKGMIKKESLEYVWQMPGQDRLYVLTDQGTAYVVENNLVV